MVYALFDKKRREAVTEAVRSGRAEVFSRRKDAVGVAPAQAVPAEAPGKAAPEQPVAAESAVKRQLRAELLHGAKTGMLVTVQNALDKGADPDSKDIEGTPVILIVAKEYWERKGWTMLGPDMDTRNLDGYARIAELLLARGADPYAHDSHGASAMHINPPSRMPPCLARMMKGNNQAGP